MRIALFQPDIAGNVGAVLRIGACFATPIDLIEPMGFAWDDKRVARAGMDYIGHVQVARHANWDAFTTNVTSRIVLFTTRSSQRLDEIQFADDDILLFGSESAGAPDFVHDRADLRVRIPLAAGMRSLNLAVSAGIALAEGLRQTKGFPDE